MIVATQGDEALALAAAEPHLDLVVTDVIMPGLGGRAVADELRRLRPGLPVLFVSGYMEESLAEVPAREMDQLPKPFTADQLLARVRALLDRSREARREPITSA